jgi:hypothetical protein
LAPGFSFSFFSGFSCSFFSGFSAFSGFSTFSGFSVGLGLSAIASGSGGGSSSARDPLPFTPFFLARADFVGGTDAVTSCELGSGAAAVAGGATLLCAAFSQLAAGADACAGGGSFDSLPTA